MTTWHVVITNPYTGASYRKARATEESARRFVREDAADYIRDRFNAFHTVFAQRVGDWLAIMQDARVLRTFRLERCDDANCTLHCRRLRASADAGEWQ